MKILFFTLFIFSNILIAQEPTCHFEVIEGEEIFSSDEKAWITERDGLKKYNFNFKKINSKEYQYTFFVTFQGNKTSVNFSRVPLRKDSSGLRSGVDVELENQSTNNEIKIVEIKPDVFGTKEPSFQYTTRDINIVNNTSEFLFDNFEDHLVKIKCSIPEMQGKLTYHKPKQAKSLQPAMVDNSSTCKVKIQDKLNTTEETLDKDPTKSNTFSKSIKTTYDGKELAYIFNVELQDSEYFIKVQRFFPPRNITSLGSAINMRMILNDQGILIPTRFDSMFEQKTRLRSEALQEKNKFTLNKAYKAKTDESLFVELIKDASKVLISCEASILEGSINISDEEISDEKHLEFLKSINQGPRKDFEVKDFPKLISTPDRKSVIQSN